MKEKDPTIAAILSFFIPGLGQVYANKIGRGILMLFATMIGYFCLILPGFIIWIVNIFDAKKQAEEYNEELEKNRKG